MFASFTGGIDAGSPGNNNLLRGNGPAAYNGWPMAPKLEALRDAWLASEDPAQQRMLAHDVPLARLLDGEDLVVGTDEAHHVAGNASRHLDDARIVPLTQRLTEGQIEQLGGNPHGREGVVSHLGPTTSTMGLHAFS